jgi:serine/threonine protein phosphatase PrpC
MSDEEINKVLKNEFVQVEQTLQENLHDLLVRRADRTLYRNSLRRGDRDYTESMNEIRAIDERLKSGAFAVVSLIVNDRLFVANVGTARIFLCFYDQKTREKSIIALDTPHTLATFSELDRLIKLNANVQSVLPPLAPTGLFTFNKITHYYTTALNASCNIRYNETESY